DLHAKLAFRQIAHVSHRRLHAEVRSQILVDRLRFRGGLNYDQFFRHILLFCRHHGLKAELRTYNFPGSCRTSRFISNDNKVAETHAVVKPLARMISSMAVSSRPTCAITFASNSLNTKQVWFPRLRMPPRPARWPFL